MLVFQGVFHDTIYTAPNKTVESLARTIHTDGRNHMPPPNPLGEGQRYLLCFLNKKHNPTARKSSSPVHRANVACPI